MSKSKNRFCPVRGDTIRSSDCAENRGPEFGCPGDCEFNPWGHGSIPEPLIDLEEAVKDWAFARRELEKKSAPRAQRASRMIGEDDILGDFCTNVEAIHVGDGSRPSPFGRWLAESPKELRRDHRMLAGWMDTCVPMLLESRQVVDETGIECVDLLDPGRPPFLLRDQELARQIPRFQLFFGWAYHTPWFCRMIGVVKPVMRPYENTPEEVIERLSLARGWEPESTDLREWLRRNTLHVSRSIAVWEELNRIALVKNSGYDESEIGLAMLRKEVDVPDREFVPEVLIERRSTLKMKSFDFEENFESDDERVIHSPPEVFLDQPIPSLGGLSPRVAVSHPDLRTRLILLVKAFIHISDKQQSQSPPPEPTDFGPMLRTLGLEDLDFPRPPLEEEMVDFSTFEDEDDEYDPEDDDYDEDDEYESPVSPEDLRKITGIANAGLPPMPRQTPINEAMVRRLYESTVKRFNTGGEMMESTMERWSDFFECASVPLINLDIPPNSPEFATFSLYFGIMAHMLHPNGPEQAGLLPFSEERLLRAFRGYQMEFASCPAPDDPAAALITLVNITRASPQPEVASTLMAQCMSLWDNRSGPIGDRMLDPSALDIVAAALLAALWEMEYLRHGKPD